METYLAAQRAVLAPLEVTIEGAEVDGEFLEASCSETLVAIERLCEWLDRAFAR